MGHRLLPRDPAQYHGKQSSRPYFEGWFFKQSSTGSAAVIPGVFRGRTGGEDFAFIQVLLSNPVQSFFVRYPFDAFSFEKDKFDIHIAENAFSMKEISLDIKEKALKAKLNYSGVTPLETSALSPSIMGPFSYVPSMQCNHGVLSLRHSVSGYLSCGGRRIEFDDADGYIEKDWGEAFPKSWIWMQCGNKEAAFVCSIAHIPYGFIRFTGLICVLLAHDVQYRFATYNGAKISSLHMKGGEASITIKRKDLRLEVNVRNKEFGSLKAPTAAGMDRIISESLAARYSIRLYKHDDEIYSGGFEDGGLEIFNAQELIKHNRHK